MNIKLLLIFILFLGCSAPEAIKPTVPSNQEGLLSADAILVASEKQIWLGSGGYVENSVFYSNDSGETWHLLPRELSPFTTQYVRLFKRKGSTLFVGNSVGFSYTDDSGKSWKYVESTQNGYSLQKKIFTYDILFSGNQWLSATDQGLHRSIDNGKSWTLIKIKDLSGLTAQEYGIKVVEKQNKLYLSSSHNVYMSTNQGVNWSLIDYSGSGPSTVDLKPAFTSTESYLWIANRLDGLYRSGDGGNSWNHVNFPDITPHREWVQGLDMGTDVLYGWNYMGIFKSKDEGNSWNWIPTSTITGLASSRIGRVFSQGDKMIVLTYMPDAYFLSIDQGLSWVNLVTKKDFPKDLITHATFSH